MSNDDCSPILIYNVPGHPLVYVLVQVVHAVVSLPHLQLAIFLTSMGLMEGRDARHIRGKFKDLYGQAIIANWHVWPLAQVRSLQAFSVSANSPPS